MNKKIIAVWFIVTSILLQGQADFDIRLSDKTLLLTQQEVVYDPAYYAIDYPGGDVPAGRGVCSDVVIRAYRQLGIDLQKEVLEDILFDFRIIGHYTYKKNLNLGK